MSKIFRKTLCCTVLVCAQLVTVYADAAADLEQILSGLSRHGKDYNSLVVDLVRRDWTVATPGSLVLDSPLLPAIVDDILSAQAHTDFGYDYPLWLVAATMELLLRNQPDRARSWLSAATDVIAARKTMDSQINPAQFRAISEAVEYWLQPHQKPAVEFRWIFLIIPEITMPDGSKRHFDSTELAAKLVEAKRNTFMVKLLFWWFSQGQIDMTFTFEQYQGSIDEVTVNGKSHSANLWSINPPLGSRFVDDWGAWDGVFIVHPIMPGTVWLGGASGLGLVPPLLISPKMAKGTGPLQAPAEVLVHEIFHAMEGLYNYSPMHGYLSSNAVSWPKGYSEIVSKNENQYSQYWYYRLLFQQHFLPKGTKAIAVRDWINPWHPGFISMCLEALRTNGVDAWNKAEALVLAGIKAGKAGDTKTAISLYEEANKLLVGGHPRAMCELAWLYYSMTGPKAEPWVLVKALATFREYLELWSDYGWDGSSLELLLVLHYNRGNWKDILDDCDRFLSKAEYSGEVLFRCRLFKTIALYNVGCFQEAYDYCAAQLAIPDNPRRPGFQEYMEKIRLELP